MDEPKTIIFTLEINQATNLPFSKPDNLSSLKIAIGGDIIESELIRGQATPVFNFAKQIQKPFTYETLNYLLTNAMVITVNEGSAHRTPMASTTVSLDPIILNGEQRISGTYRLNCIAPYQSATTPEIDLSISVSQSLFSEGEALNTNCISITVKGAYSLPTEIGIIENEAKVFKYSLGFDLANLTISSNALPTFTGNDIVNFSGAYSGPQNVEIPLEESEMFSELAKADATQKNAESSQNFVYWGQTQRVFVSAQNAKVLKDNLDKAAISHFFFCFSRVLNPDFDDLGDINAHRFHAIIPVDVTSLGLIGVKSLCGRYSFVPFPNSVPVEHVAVSPTEEKKPLKGRKMPTPDKKRMIPKKRNRSKEVEQLLMNEIPDNTFLFEQKHSYIILSISLLRPLFPRPLTPKIQFPLTNFLHSNIKIVPRSKLQKPDDEFNTKIYTLLDVIAQSYIKKFGLQNDHSTSRSHDVRRKEFFEYLNKSVYFELKEQLKKPIYRIVKEQFFKENFACLEERDVFLNELYCHLIDQIHIAMKNHFKNRTNPRSFPIRLGMKEEKKSNECDRLLRLANESLDGDDFANAEKRLKQRVAFEPQNSENWNDLGCFYLRTDHKENGEQCLLKALDYDNENRRSLLTLSAFGILSHPIRSEVFLLTLLKQTNENDNLVIGLLVALLFFSARREEEEHVRAKAKGKNASATFLNTVQFLLDTHNFKAAELLLLERQKIDNSPSVNAFLAQCFLHNKELDRSELVAHQALTTDNNCSTALIVLAEISELNGKPNTAIDFLERVVTTEPNQTTARLFLLLGRLCYRAAKFNEAKGFFLSAIRSHSHTLGWIGCAEALIALQLYEDAEDALTEANSIDNENVDVWLLLTLVCLRQQHLKEANVCFATAARIGFGFGRPQLLIDVCAEFLSAFDSQQSFAILFALFERLEEPTDQLEIDQTEVQKAHVLIAEMNLKNINPKAKQALVTRLYFSLGEYLLKNEKQRDVGLRFIQRVIETKDAEENLIAKANTLLQMTTEESNQKEPTVTSETTFEKEELFTVKPQFLLE